MTLIATKSMSYAGRRLAVGDKFEPKTDHDARLLKAIGKAKDALAVEPELAPTPEPTARKGYKRRDMKAED